jgi:hypothetical protein
LVAELGEGAPLVIDLSDLIVAAPEGLRRLLVELLAIDHNCLLSLVVRRTSTLALLVRAGVHRLVGIHTSLDKTIDRRRRDDGE